jgi:hypothetical protein
MASLSPKATIVASSVALLSWAAALLATFQIAYSLNASSLLGKDLALTLAALVGFSATLLLILSRSRLEPPSRLVLAGAALCAFLFLVFWGSLSVACANGNCL